MSKTQVSIARKVAAGAVCAVMASALAFPSAALALDSGTVDGTDIVNGTAVAETAGTGGGTWAYDGADTISLNNFVGASIDTIGDTIIQLNGQDNSVDYDVWTDDGDLTIKGDSTVYGKDKPSITVKGDNDYFHYVGADGNVTIEDANVYANTESAEICSGDGGSGNLTIKDSGIYRGSDNEHLYITAYGDDAVMTLKGSEIQAAGGMYGVVWSDGTMVIDNTNLTVSPCSHITEFTEDGWITGAVAAVDGIELKGEANGKVVEYTNASGSKWFYVTTGALDKVELKASETPAYYGPAKAMPKTGDNTMAIVFGAGTALVLSAAAAAFALRKRNEER